MDGAGTPALLHEVAAVILAVAAVLGPVAGILAAWWARKGHKSAERTEVHAAAANDAVNNIHPGSGPKLYDRVVGLEGAVRSGFRSNDDTHQEIRDAVVDLGHKVNGRIDTVETTVKDLASTVIDQEDDDT